MEKYCGARQATDDNMACVHCMLGAKGYKNTLRIWNTYCFDCNKGWTNLSQCYVVCTLCVLLSWNGTKFGIRYYKQFLAKKSGIQKNCWLDDDYILEDVGAMCALLVLRITVFEIKNMISENL